MSFANPTPIRIGMTGAFDGRQYRVAGRVVLGMEEDGETYYWNEFNLVSDDGESATLVFEETERGGEWRLFTLFEPEFVMTAEDAATKRVGDQLNLDGHDVRVTLVDETRVYHIEGEAPEGVELGDVAHYFNAEAGSRMVVVSWTGEEVEYYRGVTVAPAMTAKLASLLQGGGRVDARRGALASLTEREREILEHLARGESNKTIARALDISHDTVKLHVRHILSKLNLSSRVEAAVFAVEARAAAAR